jgi:hypothetical protein
VGHPAVASTAERPIFNAKHAKDAKRAKFSGKTSRILLNKGRYAGLRLRRGAAAQPVGNDQRYLDR